MSTVALTTFAIEPSDFGNRAQIVLILLLNSVTYKFAVSAELPRFPYMYSTTLDTYIHVHWFVD